MKCTKIGVLVVAILTLGVPTKNIVVDEITTVNQQGVEVNQVEEVKEVKDITVSISMLGDVMLGTHYGAKRDWNNYYDKYGPEYFFDGVRKEFIGKDMVISNIENVFTEETKGQPGKIYTYKAHPKYLSVIEKSGITHASVVNNHMQDFMQTGFDESTSLLDSIGIKWFGSNEFISKSAEMGNIKVDRKEIFEKDGLKIGLISYYGFWDSYATDKMIYRDINYFNENNVDYIIAYVHWGGQNTHNPTVRQKSYGNMLIDNGVDLVVGGHPHALQPVVEYKGKHIYYSLGDFLFVDRKTPITPYSVIVNLDLTKKENGELVEDFSHIPVIWSGDKSSNTYQPKVTNDKEDIKKVYNLLNVEK